MRCNPLLEGVRFVTLGTHVRGIVSTETSVCVRPSLASKSPGGRAFKYICSWTSFADLTSLCPSIVLLQ